MEATPYPSSPNKLSAYQYSYQPLPCIDFAEINLLIASDTNESHLIAGDTNESHLIASDTNESHLIASDTNESYL